LLERERLSENVETLIADLAGFGSQDPADRFLVATAIVEELTLVTVDPAMLVGTLICNPAGKRSASLANETRLDPMFLVIQTGHMKTINASEFKAKCLAILEEVAAYWRVPRRRCRRRSSCRR